MRIGRLSHHEEFDSDIHGVTGTVLGTEDKDVASGIAAVDSNILLSPAIIPVCEEVYGNHLGATDNFTEIVTSGNGTATPDATNHEMDLSTGVSGIGYTIFKAKDYRDKSEGPIAINIILRNIVVGTAGVKKGRFGMRYDWTDQDDLQFTGFRQNSDGTWHTVTSGPALTTEESISTPSNKDLLTILIESTKARFFVEGTLVSTHTSNVSSANMYLGAALYAEDGNITSARSISVDMIRFRQLYT